MLRLGRRQRRQTYKVNENNGDMACKSQPPMMEDLGIVNINTTTTVMSWSSRRPLSLFALFTRLPSVAADEPTNAAYFHGLPIRILPACILYSVGVKQNVG